MKYRLLTGLMFAGLTLPMAVSATNYELIAGDKSFETNLCIKSAVGPVQRYKREVKKVSVRASRLNRLLECNDMQVTQFVAQYGTAEMKTHFNVLSTDVQIQDITLNTDKKIQIIVSSTLAN